MNALALALLLAAPARAGLGEEAADAAKALSGRAGVYAAALGSAPAAALNADETFPTASLVKVPLLAVLFDRIEKGELGYSDPLLYRSSRAYDGEDMLAASVDGSTTTPAKLAFLAAKMSDNTAALWVQELAGGGEAVNRWLAARGYEATRVNSRTPGREEDRARWGWGQTTPREMARLMASIWSGTCVSPSADAELRRVLTGSYWDGEALSVLPPGAAVISKQGAVDAARGEALVVQAPSGPYVLVALTKGLKDPGYAPEQEGFVFLRKVSAAAWRRFAPGAPWTPPPPGRFRKG